MPCESQRRKIKKIPIRSKVPKIEEVTKVLFTVTIKAESLIKFLFSNF